MPLRMGAVEDALLEAGASKESAAKAAEELTQYVHLDAKVDRLAWMVGTLIALVLGNLWLTVQILERLPR